MVKANQTKLRIIATAEALFAEQGFEQTSLRQITSQADVNLASVNYHFGSKKALIQAVMERYEDVFMPALAAELELLPGPENGLTTDHILQCVVKPLLATRDIRRDGPIIYLQLLGYAYSEIQGHLRRHVMERYGDVLHHLFKLVQQANGHLTPATLFWRLHFSLGAALFAQVSGQALAEIAAADFNEENSPETIVFKLLPYVAAGIAAPAQGSA